MDQTRLRCVLGTDHGDPTMWCKLAYTGWFELEPRGGGCALAQHSR